MVSTRSRYYRSPSPDFLECAPSSDLEPGSDTDEAFEPVSALDTDRRLQVWSVGTFDDMEDDHRHVVRDRFSGRAGGISLPDWQLRFQTWMKEKRQRMPSFNDYYAFELLPQHLELEALQTYGRWTELHVEELNLVEEYWLNRVELVTALKEGAVANVPTRVNQPKPEGDAGSSMQAMSRLAQATRAALEAVGPPPSFDPLAKFMAHLEVEYGGFRRDQMHRIQDFHREKEDTPRTMYTRLARLAAEAGDVFTERQLVKIFISKLDKRMVELITPHLLFRYHGNATLAEAFAEVEVLDRALGVSEATDLVTSLMDAPKSKKLATATGSLAETQPERVVHCWSCGEAGHTKGDPICPKKKGGGGDKAKAKTDTAKSGEKSGEKAGGKAKKPLTCSHCGKSGHGSENCFVLHPEKRPTSSGAGSEAVKTLQAELAELKKQMSAMASLGQVVNTTAPVWGPGSSSTMGTYFHGALGQVVAAVATRAQTTAQTVAPPSVPVSSVGRPRHGGLPDHIGQARLPLSFSTADAVTSGAVPTRTTVPQVSSTHGDAAHSLAYKVLQLPVFTGADLLTLDSPPARVFHLAGSMLEGKVPMPSLAVSQAVMAPPTEEDLVAMRAQLAAEAIAAFDANATSTPVAQSSGDQSLVSGVAYLSDVAARSARERCTLRPGVVRLANNGGVMAVGRTDGPSIRATPLRVILDTGAQPVMIGRQLAQDLGLGAADLEPCPFTIVTSVGSTEKAMGYTRHPLRLMFGVGTGPLYSHVSLQCAVTDATNYDILVGQHALYPLGFGVDNWTEEAWIRPGWAAGDGRKELIPVVFGASAVTSPVEAMVACSALASDLPCGLTLLEETYAFMSGVAEPRDHVPVATPARHCKDLRPSWGTQLELTRRSHEIVNQLDAPPLSVDSSTSLLARTIQWRPPDEGITLVELFAGIGTGLAAVLEAGLKVRRYIHVDSGFAANRAARHHMQRLLALYPEQLPPSAIHGCFGKLPRDVTLVSDDDLRRLGHVDLVIAGWPCQGHSRAGSGRGLDDPRSGLFADLVRLIQWWTTHQSTPPGYIFENVPPLGDTRVKVHEDGAYIHHLLGPPTFVDAAALGSYAHRPRWIWTNLAASATLTSALSQVRRPARREVDDILDDHRVSTEVSKDDEPPLAMVNRVGFTRGAFPTLMSYPRSFAFRAGGPGMVWDTTSQSYEEPSADERERAMGFLTGTTAAPGLSEGQRRFLLGQAIDLNTLVWVCGLCFAVQHGMRDHPRVPEADSDGQGAAVPHLTEVEESELLYRLEQHAAEELRAQRVFAALAEDFGREDARDIFSRFYHQDVGFSVDPVDEEVGGMDALSATK